MKNISTIIQVILVVAVLGLYGLHFSGAKSNACLKNTSQANNGELRIAYLKLDSIIVNYTYAQELHKELAEKQEAYNKEFGTKRLKFEQEAAAFQEKLQKGGFISQQRAIQERDRLAGVEQEIQKMDYELSTKLAELQANNNKQIVDTISNFLDQYNAEMNYTYIINSSGVLKGQEGNNITSDVLNRLNARNK